MAHAIGELHRVCEAAGRDPATIEVGHFILWPVSWTAESAPDGSRRLVTGTSADMAADLVALARAGVRHVSLIFQTASAGETIARMTRFAAEVMPLVR